MASTQPTHQSGRSWYTHLPFATPRADVRASNVGTVGQTPERRMEEGRGSNDSVATPHRRLMWLREMRGGPHRNGQGTTGAASTPTDNFEMGGEVDDDEALRGIPLATLPIQFASANLGFNLEGRNKAKERERESRRELKTFWGPRVVLDPTEISDGAQVPESETLPGNRGTAPVAASDGVTASSTDAAPPMDVKESEASIKLGQAEIQTLLSPSWTKSAFSARQVSEWTRRANQLKDDNSTETQLSAVLPLETNVNRSSVEIRMKASGNPARSNLLFTVDCDRSCRVDVIFFAREGKEFVMEENRSSLEADRFTSAWTPGPDQMRWSTTLSTGYRQNVTVPIPDIIDWSQSETQVPGSHLDPIRAEVDRLIETRKSAAQATGSVPASPKAQSSSPSSSPIVDAPHSSLFDRIKGKKTRSPVLSASDASSSRVKSSIELEEIVTSTGGGNTSIDQLHEQSPTAHSPTSSSDLTHSSPTPIWPIVIITQSLSPDTANGSGLAHVPASSSKSRHSGSANPRRTNAQMTFIKVLHSSSGSSTARVARQSAKIGEMTMTLHEIYGVGESDIAPAHGESDSGLAKEAIDALPLDTGEGSKDLPPTLHLCVICLSEPRTSLMLPCRHLALCNDCANQVMETGSRYGGGGSRGWNCVICRRPFHSIVDIRRERKEVGSSRELAATTQGTDDASKLRTANDLASDDSDALRLRGGATSLEAAGVAGESVTVSAPGKVLMAGGYLVLDPAFSGHVLSTSARFYTKVASARGRSVTIRSPQFMDGLWICDLTKEANGVTTLMAHDLSKQNTYVQMTAEIVINIAEHRGINALSGLELTLLADNDFYSQRSALEEHKLTPTLSGLKALPRFNATNSTMQDVHKTGLGSSAALITSLTCALMLHYGLVDRRDIETRHQKALVFVHNVAQYAHCVVQGKIGSGFDVAAAVYGSQTYRRFEPSVFAGLLDWKENLMGPDRKAFLNRLCVMLERPLAGQTRYELALPCGLRLLLGDVDAGSHTPTMVSKVMAWKAKNTQEGRTLFDQIHQTNKNFSQALEQLSVLAASDVKQWTEQLKQAAVKVEGTELASLRHSMQEARRLMKELGRHAQVPIEPDEQSRLLDVLEQVPGVIGGCVPGAGGYDAIALMVIDNDSSTSESPSTTSMVEKLWQGWRELNVSPLLTDIDRRVSTSGGGMQIEESL